MSAITDSEKKAPARPLPTFGLRLGLMVTFMTMGVTPLLKVYIAYRLNAGENEIAWGVPFDLWIKLVGICAVATLIATVLAWRGRPAAIQWILPILLVMSLILICAEAAVRYYSDCPTCIIQVNQDFINRIFRFLIPLQVLTVIYMVWYINREPAKRFYRE